jgi:PAS domain S-box-containing protein
MAGAFERQQAGTGSLAIAKRSADDPVRIYVTLLDKQKLAAELQDIKGQRSEALFVIDSNGRTINRTTRNSTHAALLSEVLNALPPTIASSPLSRQFEHKGQSYLAAAMQIPGYDLRVVSITRAAEVLSSWTDYLPLWSIMIFGPSLLGAALSWALLNQMEQTTRSRNALRRTEERFELAVSGARCGIWDWDVPNRSMYWSGAMNALLGLGSQPRIVRLDELTDRLHAEDRNTLRNIEEAILRGGEHYDESFRLRHEDGHYVWVRAKGHAYRTLRAEHPRLSGIALDITDQKQAAERLNVTERVLKAAFEGTQGQDSEILEEAPGEYFIVRVDRVVAPAMPPVAEVRPNLARNQMMRKMAEAVRARATRAYTTLRPRLGPLATELQLPGGPA